MKDRKIIKALTKMSVYELNSFRKFLISPYFNQNEACVAFFDLIDNILRNGQNFDTLSNEEIWEKVYGEIPYVDVKLRKLSSDLFALFEDYIAQKAMEGDEAQKLQLLMKAYTNRNLSDLYGSLIKSIEYNKKILKNKDSLYYLNMFYIEKAIMNINFHDNTISRKSEMDKILNVEEASYNLDVFFIAEKLKSYCTLLSYNQTYKLDKKIIGIDIILKLARSPFFKDYPPIAIYYLISQIKTDEDNEENYYKLKELYLKNLHIFDRKEAKDLLDLIMGYCITKVNKGLAKYDIEAFYWCKVSIKEDLIIRDEHISPVTFRNMVFYGLRNSEYEWAENFIRDYNGYLQQDFRESNVSFSLARLEWYRKDYKKVIGHLINTEYKEVFQALLSRTLLLLSFYELHEYDSLFSLLNSFKLYLDREKSLTKQRKLQYYNLIRFSRILLKLSIKDKIKLSKLKEEVETTEWVVNKAWLLEKIDELLFS